MMPFQPLKRFDSLADGFAELSAEFPDRTTSNTMIIEGGLARSTQPDAPTYLFRGENSAYPSTEPVLVRLGKGELEVADLAEVEQVRDALEQRLTAWLRGGEDMPDAGHCRSYLQHYGLPFDGLDLTGSLKVAAFFAAWHGRKTQAIAGEGTGLICVAEADALRGGGGVEDVRDHRYAWRPRAQHAYIFRSRDHVDLKSDAAVEKLGLKWFAFRVTPDDRARFGSTTYLLETHIDAVACWLCTAMYTYFKEHGPVRRSTAEWLADRLPPVPMMMKPVGTTETGEQIVESVTPGEAGVVYIESDLRRVHAQNWSTVTYG